MTAPAQPAGPLAAGEVVRAALEEAQLGYDQPTPTSFVVTLPGEAKLSTTVSLVLGAHSLSVNAFVARRPDENAEGVYRWLLERNLRSHGVAFAVDPAGDIYLAGRVSLSAVTVAEVDLLLGCVLELADGSFNPILELGFASAIRREWQWRTRRGESTANLAAFRSLLASEPRDPGHASGQEQPDAHR